MIKLVVRYIIVFFIFHVLDAQNETTQDHRYIPASKQKINDIVDKINNIVKYILSKETNQNKKELLDNIENKLTKAAKFLGSKAKKNVQLIMEGINIKLSEIIDNQRKTNKALNKSYIFNKPKLLNKLFQKFGIHMKSNSKKRNLANYQIHNNSSTILEHNSSSTNEQEYFINNTRRKAELFANNANSDDVDLLKTTNRPKSQTANVEICSNAYTRICSNVKQLNSFKCVYVDVNVALEDICNNYIDCPDRSDEKYCNKHVTNKVEQANLIMADVESSYKHRCFEIDDRSSVLKKHSEVLQNLLQAQLNFKEKFRKLGLIQRPDDKVRPHESSDRKTVKRTGNEIALIISALALALNGALCSNQHENQGMSDDIFETNFDQDLKEVIWPPKSCECQREYCIKCSDTCKRICWHKHSLTRWNCESIDSTESVSLNVLCDGKLDCFDESDEKECVFGTGYAKFEAHEIYGNTVKILQSRTAKEISSIQIKLSNVIMKLQEETTKPKPPYALIRKLRTKCYSLISSLYLDMMKNSHFVSESEEAYIFLLSINKNVAAAMKRSSTGNKKLISDECYCRNGYCAVSRCPRSCVKSCSVESKIMKYKCQGDNASILLNKVCDGHPDCPNGYDEFQCQKDEICRQHHLIVLRRRLQEAGKEFKGTSLGETLASWRSKVISSVKVAAKSGRPQPKLLRKMIKAILKDLVLTYGAVEDYRKSNTDYALEVFVTIAQRVMNTLKSCGK